MAGPGGSPEFRNPPTWAEREFLKMLAEQAGTPDEPITDLNLIPQPFWDALVMATDYYLIGFNRPSGRSEADGWRNAWRTWEHTFIWGTGLGPFFDHPWAEFQKIVRMGTSSAREIPEHTWDAVQEKIQTVLSSCGGRAPSGPGRPSTGLLGSGQPEGRGALRRSATRRHALPFLHQRTAPGDGRPAGRRAAGRPQVRRRPVGIPRGQ